MTAEEFEAIFHGVDLPETVQLGPGVKVVDLPKFIDTQLIILKSSQNEQYKSVVEARLMKLKEVIGL